ncbi:T9SS type A sorting domain-containing protein [Hymenobacter sp. HMF4947]|uniref:T9SS type A sorting domain-containing protein n=1 Tax=Hymenobacter ginkgonis TaxID=2682976 RepID=A0A7K1T910_9BACT|nr:endonuclease [Hymenobacter ginkgonis]MVN74899.1 T9SS type A sorting domain-containing protein [Hymenobacter ginkgonis]
MHRLFRLVLVCLSLGPLLGRAQTVPTVPAPAPANLTSQALRDWLRTNWYDPYRRELSYADARAKMYNYADNYDNKVVCVYSGYSETVPYSFTNTSTSVVTSINCEHSIPQSWFKETVRMRSDMHHLYPTYITWNSNRGSDPYAEIPDAQTRLWMRLTQSQTSIPTTNIDEYSEDTNSQFEPREDHKGNLARTAFYFYTMHAGQPDLVATGHNDINTLADLNTLYQWHLADPVDEHERERNRRVAASQGNYNPYINDPTLVARAWGFAPTGPVISFATATSSVPEGNSGFTTYTATLNVSPAPTAALVVQVALDATSSTATSGVDFTFPTPTTVTFAAGQTSQTVSLTVTGDTQPEADETVVLTLQNPGTGASLGGPSTHTLILTNDDGNPPTVAFATATGSLPEGNSGTSTYAATVTLANPGNLPFPIMVPVLVDAASTASSPSDYILATNTLTFASATALSQTVRVTVIGDLLPEPNETVVLRLGTPSAAGLVLGAARTHTLTIGNDDAAPVGGSCTDPFFSKYFESAAGNTKALEIFNPTASPLDLSGLRVELFAPGATTPTSTATLTGTVAASGVYVIANTGVTDTGVKAVANLQSNVCFFNGPHALVLFDGTDTLDVIGVVGRTPAGAGTSWAVASGGNTRDNSLVRLPTTGRGNSRWFGPTGAATTWQAQGTDNFTGLGSYTSTACATVLAVRGASAGRPTLTIYPNPATGHASLLLPGAPATQPATVEVLDAVGRLVRHLTAPLGATLPAELGLTGLPAGLYAVRVATAEGQYIGRLVVE